MANAARDQNRVTTLIGVSSVDLTTPITVAVDPITHRVLTNATASSGIVSINSDTTSAQILAVGTAGTDFAIVDNGTGTHTFNLPTASATNRGALSSADWTTFNNKGSGTVTAVSVATANGLAGTSSGGATPALTLSTTINAPVLAGNGTAIAAATTSGTGSTVILQGSPTITNPTVGTQAATDNSTLAASTAYVTTSVANAIAGVNPAISVSAATTVAGNTSTWTYNNGVSGIGATFTGPVNTAITIDGITFSALTQSLLVKNDTQSPSGAFNGIYNLTALQTVGTGAIFTRRLDYDTPSDINNTGAIPVVGGTVNATTSWLQTSNIVTVGTTPLTYTQFSYSPTTIIPPNLGGTGIANNSASTITISGSFGTTFNVSGATSLTLPAVTDTVAVLGTAQTYTATQTEKQVVWSNNAITATTNAATVPITSRLNTITNNSAATLTITMTTTSAVDGQLSLVRILDFSAVAQTLTFVNTENSTVSVPATTNGSTTLPLTVGFQFNGGTSKWRCIASA